MIHAIRLAAWATGTSVAVLLLTPAAAAATFPAPDGPTQPNTTVQLIEVAVPVPVDDTTSEAIQMAVAAALGATVAAAVRVRRSRRQSPDTGTSSMIDITDIVQSVPR